MKRQDQISKAIKLLQPNDKAAARRYVSEAIAYLNDVKSDNQSLEDLAAKNSRKSLVAFRRALARAEVTFKSMPNGMKLAIARSIEIEGQTSIPFGAAIRICDKILAAPHHRSKIDYVGLNAAASAWNLFGLLEFPDPPLTKGGKWPKLAAILVDTNKDMFHHCRRYSERSASSGSK
jgi:hypothetical protein